MSEIIHSFMCHQVLCDFTPGDGTAGVAALSAGVVYVGVCFSDKHVALLREFLKKQVLALMANDKCQKLYNVRYAMHVKAKKGSVATGPKADADPKDPNDKPNDNMNKPTNKPNPKGKKDEGKGKKKNKKKRSTSSSSEDSRSG